MLTEIPHGRALMIIAIALSAIAGCAPKGSTTTSEGNHELEGCPIFFSRALDVILEDDHLTIVMPARLELIDSIIADEHTDLPVEIRCESSLDKEVLAFHLTFRPDSPALARIEDDRFRLLHTEERLAEPMTICIERASNSGAGKVRTKASFTSASIVKKEA
jgi:hypothetical protein